MAEKGRKINKLEEVFVHYTDGRRFLQRCTKPTRREFLQMLRAQVAGVLFLGSLGYLIKLVHIPINNIIVGK